MTPRARTSTARSSAPLICLFALAACGRSPLDLPATGGAGGGGRAGSVGNAGSAGHTGAGGGAVTGAAGSGLAGSGVTGVAGAGGSAPQTGIGGTGVLPTGGAGTTGAAGSGIDGGTKMNGHACGGPTECASTFCANGVCCATTCENRCQSCAVPGSIGVCSPAPPGTICSPAGCSGNMSSPARSCDGKGTCVAIPLPPQSCAPYACNAERGTCNTGCATDDDCFNTTCVNRRCVAKAAIGDKCVLDSDCARSSCVDGFCCNAPCVGPCISCAVPGHEGACWASFVGELDPRGICTDQGAASCGTNGRCDGAGACQVYAPGTACAAVECTVTKFSSGVCDAFQSCIVTFASCEPYACLADASGCNVNCHGGDSACAPGFYCAGGELCAPQKGAGQSCTRNAECASNVCSSAAGSVCVGLVSG